MNVITQKNTERFKKLPHVFKSKFLFFFLGFWLMVTVFHYVDVIKSSAARFIGK